MISNSMFEDIKEQLGENYRNTDEALVKSLIDRTITIALSVSNRSNRPENIQILKPYIEECVIGDYLNRGGEGLNSLSDSGKNSSFKNNKEVMRKNIIADGLRLVF